jgi:MGT family glycosyltransferase
VSRYLFVVPPLVGHVNPTIGVGRELAARGHEVAWAGPREVVGDLVPDDRFIAVGSALPAGVRRVIRGEVDDLRGVSAVKHLVGEFLVPLAESMLPGVRAAVDGFAPDAVLVDQQALAGVAVCEAVGLPWATSASTSATLHDTLEALPRLKEWADGLQRGFLRSAGVPDGTVATMDIRFSPHLVIVFSTRAFVGQTDFPHHYAFVGPSIDQRSDDTPFDWDWLAGDGYGLPLVLVSLGTLNTNNGASFFRKACAALAALDVQGVVVAPPDLVPDPPPNVLVAPRVPQLALMPRAAGVVCHGGHNTVCEALAHGVPLVVAPIRDDQPTIADQVVAAGAGRRVKFGRATPGSLREAIETILTSQDIRVAARRVRDSFRAAGGPGVAADHLERLPVPTLR